MTSIQLRKEWRNGKWHDIFKADNILSFDIRDNCLLDDFCDYCCYTIEEQRSDSNSLVIRGPVNLLGYKVKIRLDIEKRRDAFVATYTFLFVSLTVTFREVGGKLVVDSDCSNIIYKPIADRFVRDGAAAMAGFMNDL
jgi:hypothetical protein